MRAPASWRIEFVTILTIALLLRAVFFVGFGLGDDLGYVSHAARILSGGYPALDPLNQYAYRPLLLLSFAAGIGVFGYTDLGVVAPVIAASLCCTAAIYLFVRRTLDPSAARWCALLYACEPFNVVNSTTMTNDVILACLVFISLALFISADVTGRRSFFVAAAVVMVAAFLVKMTVVPALVAVALYSGLAVSRDRAVFRRHAPFYVSFALGIAGICFVYFLLKGDPLWQFKSELVYYESNKPDWYLRGDIDYRNLLWEYPRSLFGLSGVSGFRYFEHGLTMWLFVVAALRLLRQPHEPIARRLAGFALIVFCFFEFYPQYVKPHYLPLVRQTRYLEMLLPAVAIVCGLFLHRLAQRRTPLALVLALVLLGDFVYEASRRWTHYADSQEDVRALASYAGTTLSQTGKPLYTDVPARNGLSFYLRNSPVQVELTDAPALADISDGYVAVGGARSFWWARDQVLDVEERRVPAGWILAYRAPGKTRPWRPNPLRVYYVERPPATLDAAVGQFRCAVPGLRETSYPSGFTGPQEPSRIVASIPNIDNATPPGVSHIEWTGWFRAADATYVFESRSDDGSWLFLNDLPVLDNGGTHPASAVKARILLKAGWYRFRFRYENVIADRFLHFQWSAAPATGYGPESGFCADGAEVKSSR